MGAHQVAVKLWGEFACFTRPEMKVERVSYPVMTPSAARGALEAIYWKPQITWHVREIHVLNPIRYLSLTRNETTDRQSHRTAKSWADNNDDGYNAADHRSQRHTLALRDVAYIVHAQLRSSTGEDLIKHREQFLRRVGRGKCFATPYLGCREFSAFFASPTAEDVPLDLNGELGSMLLDIGYNPDNTGRGTPRFFSAELTSGVLVCPDRFGDS